MHQDSCTREDADITAADANQTSVMAFFKAGEGKVLGSTSLAAQKRKPNIATKVALGPMLPKVQPKPERNIRVSAAPFVSVNELVEAVEASQSKAVFRRLKVGSNLTVVSPF